MRPAFGALLLITPLAAPLDVVRAQSSWSVDPSPVLRIAGATANREVLIEHPIAATRLANGSVLVGDDHAATVLLFDSTGRLVQRVGRRGDGPGEFRHIWWLGQCGGDSVFVWDFFLRRMSVLSPTGVIVRQYLVPADRTAGPSPHTVACSPKGIFAYQPLARPPALPSIESPFVRGQAIVSLGDSRGNITQSVGQILGGEMVVLGGGGGPRPLGKRTSLALSENRLYVGTADSAFVDVFSIDGRRLSSIPIRVSGRKAARRNFERAVEDVVASIHGTNSESLRRRLLAIEMPTHLPPYTALLTDTRNVLWIVLTAPGDSGTDLRALGEAGRVLADIHIPVGLTVFEIGQDYVLGGYEDENGEPSVGVFRLRRGR